MENKNIIIIAIVVVIIALACVAGFVFTKNNDTPTAVNNTNSTNSSTVANNTENVTAKLMVKTETTYNVVSQITELTNAKAKIVRDDTVYTIFSD